MRIEKANIDVIGQGYVGLPLAIELLKKDSNSIVDDLKGFLPRNQVNSRLLIKLYYRW